jgi:ribosomal protein L31E
LYYLKHGKCCAVQYRVIEIRSNKMCIIEKGESYVESLTETITKHLRKEKVRMTVAINGQRWNTY